MGKYKLFSGKKLTRKSIFIHKLKFLTKWSMLAKEKTPEFLFFRFYCSNKMKLKKYRELRLDWFSSAPPFFRTPPFFRI